MKTILEFDDEDLRKRELYLQAEKMYSALSDIREYLRNTIKYSDLNKTESGIYNDINDKFWETIENNKIDLEL